MGSTLPLYAAAVAGDAEAVAELLRDGADPNAESPGVSEGTPLCAAACWGHESVVAFLLAAGADPNLVEEQDLPMASDRGSIELVSLLVERGAIDDGEALAVAESWVGVDVEASLREAVGDGVELVVRREARPDGSELIEVTARRDDGASTVARQTGHARIVELLREQASADLPASVDAAEAEG